jgi:hypothetical protein
MSTWHQPVNMYRVWWHICSSRLSLTARWHWPVPVQTAGSFLTAVNTTDPECAQPEQLQVARSHRCFRTGKSYRFTNESFAHPVCIWGSMHTEPCRMGLSGGSAVIGHSLGPQTSSADHFGCTWPMLTAQRAYQHVCTGQEEPVPSEGSSARQRAASRCLVEEGKDGLGRIGHESADQGMAAVCGDRKEFALVVECAFTSHLPPGEPLTSLLTTATSLSVGNSQQDIVIHAVLSNSSGSTPASVQLSVHMAW